MDMHIDMPGAIAALQALAQETRLAAFRALVEAGPPGMAAGAIARRLRVAPASLSFHLQALVHAGLASSRRQGRSVIYRADFAAMESLLGFLTENCCRGAPPTGTTPTMTHPGRTDRHEKDAHQRQCG